MDRAAASIGLLRCWRGVPALPRAGEFPMCSRKTLEMPVRPGPVAAGSGTAMGDFPHYVDIILFAMVAAFLVLRLRSVLGRRTGNERRRDPAVRPAEATRDNFVGVRRNDAPARPVETAAPGSVAAGIA